jgi:hypothetical protein
MAFSFVNKKVAPSGYLGDPAEFDVSWRKRDLEEGCRMMADAIESYLKRGK